jgi:hypothetical protein
VIGSPCLLLSTWLSLLSMLLLGMPPTPIYMSSVIVCTKGAVQLETQRSGATQETGDQRKGHVGGAKVKKLRLVHWSWLCRGMCAHNSQGAGASKAQPAHAGSGQAWRARCRCSISHCPCSAMFLQQRSRQQHHQLTIQRGTAAQHLQRDAAASQPALPCGQWASPQYRLRLCGGGPPAPSCCLGQLA